MRFLDRRRRDRIAAALADDEQLCRALRRALREESERIVAADHCEPIPCDAEDNYVCAWHRRG